MGVREYLEQAGLSPAQLSEALSLEEHEILLVTPASGEWDLEVVLLTDERGLERRAELFTPEIRSRGERRRVGVIYTQVGSVDVYVEVHLRSNYEDLLQALEQLDPWGDDDSDRLGGLPRETAVQLLSTLGMGRPVANPGGLAELQARLDMRKLAAWNIHHALRRSTFAIASAERSLRGSDTENAYLKLSAAYDALGDAVLFARGEGADRWRQRLPRLRALGPPPFVERYLDVMLQRRGPSEPLGAFVARQLDAAHGVAARLRSEASMEPSCA